VAQVVECLPSKGKAEFKPKNDDDDDDDDDDKICS
jgi:hypothetical protein